MRTRQRGLIRGLKPVGAMCRPSAEPYPGPFAASRTRLLVPKVHLRRPIDPPFIGKRGPLTARGLQQRWKRAIRHAGLPDELSIHSARHTIAVHMLKRTGNLRMVQKQLGHASPATTANMYADVSFEDMQNALNGLYETADGTGK